MFMRKYQARDGKTYQGSYYQDDRVPDKADRRKKQLPLTKLMKQRSETNRRRSWIP